LNSTKMSWACQTSRFSRVFSLYQYVAKSQRQMFGSVRFHLLLFSSIVV
jgi:hypothetical protein